MKSKKHLKRRKISKQKTFKYNRNGEIFTTKGLTAQSALSKLLRKRVSVHETNINPLNIAAAKLRINYRNVVSSFKLNFGRVSKLRLFLNFIIRIFGFKLSIDIQRTEKKAKRKEKIIAEVLRANFELTRPYLSEFKILY